MEQAQNRDVELVTNALEEDPQLAALCAQLLAYGSLTRILSGETLFASVTKPDVVVGKIVLKKVATSKRPPCRAESAFSGAGKVFCVCR